MQLSNLKTTDEIDIEGKILLVRADLNVPLRDGAVSDATRLERIVPGIKAWCAHGAKVVLLSHFGRPKGERNEAMSLRPVAATLSELIGKPVAFGDDCIGPTARRVVDDMADGDICVLENLRFHGEEEANDSAFAKDLATLGDFYVNDAFSAAHRAHASTDGLAFQLPAFAGPLMMEEIDALQRALEAPKRPTAAVVGGAKVSSKIPVLSNLMSKVDKLIIGGGMANTFLLANGVSVGASLAEPDLVEEARRIAQVATSHDCEVLLPSDVVVAKQFKAGAEARISALDGVAGDDMILDVGPETVARLSRMLAGCQTLLWNGPLGAFEIEPFGKGTFALANEAARLTKAGKLVSVAGGGDTVAALNAAGVADDYTYVSSAGGAFLEWLEGKELPGVAALARSSV
ncbi:MAG: phosphoglycerate kinase [Hyphomicrobiaceae bacterium]